MQIISFTATLALVAAAMAGPLALGVPASSDVSGDGSINSKLWLRSTATQSRLDMYVLQKAPVGKFRTHYGLSPEIKEKPASYLEVHYDDLATL